MHEMHASCVSDDCVTVFQPASVRRAVTKRNLENPGVSASRKGQHSSYVHTAYALRVMHASRDTCGRVPAVSGVDGDGAGARAGRRAAAAPRNPENETHAGGNDVNKAGTYERGRPRTISPHQCPQSRTGRVRRRRLYGVPTRRRAHRLTRETCGASASE